MKDIKISTMSVFLGFFLLCYPPPLAADDEVDCDNGGTIAERLDNLDPGDTLTVSGTCNEHVVIPEEIHRITLDGRGTATINGPDATRTVVNISGKGITIKGFTIIGGRGGIVVTRGEATIEGNIIKETGGNGVNLRNHSFARIIDNTIIDNPDGGGVVVSHTSTARIGFTGNPQTRVPRPNTIMRNRDGIVVQSTSFVELGFNTISDNTGRGVRVRRGSSARLGGLSDIDPSGNFIQNNDREGIQVFDSTAEIRGNTISDNGRAGIVLRASSAVIRPDDVGPTPNTISNNGQGRRRSGIDIGQVSLAVVNDNVIDGNRRNGITLEENSGLNLSGNSGSNDFFGLACGVGAYASGSIGTLTGTGGVAVFDGTCIENLSDFP